jgi:transposase
MKKQDARSLNSESQEALRRQVVAALEGGMNQTEAATAYGISRGAVCNWWGLYRRGGDAALAAKAKGRPRQLSLLPWQCAQVARTLTDRCPDQLKLPFYLWTREAVGKLIERRFGVRLSVWTVGRYLKRWGFTPQKPIRRALERDPVAVEQWLEEEYPAIRRAAKRAGAEIHWGDEMGLRSDHQTGRSYGLKGRTPVIPGTGQRFGCNLISTVTNRGTLRFMVFAGKFNAGVLVRFLGRLLKSSPAKVFLILDGHPTHRARKVARWVEERKDRLRLFYLPAYSPELNPDEFLNNDVKSNAVGRQRASSRGELVANVRGYLRSTQQRPDIVQKYFHAKSVQYALI